MALQFSLFSPRIHLAPLIRCSGTSIFARKFVTDQEALNSDVIAAPPPPELKVSNPFVLFIQAQAIQFSTYDRKDRFKVAGKIWHTLDEYQKNEYLQRAQQNKNENMGMMKVYETKYTKEQREKFKFLELQAKRMKKEEAAKREARKVNPKITGYNLFTHEFAKTFDSAGKKGLEYLNALSSAVSKSWRNLSSSEKEVFNNRALEIKKGGKE